MYYSLFGRCYPPRSRTGSCLPRPQNQQKANAGQGTPPKESKGPHPDAVEYQKDRLLIKSASFGGFVLPEGTDKKATFYVASLNLDTSDYKNFLVQLDFSCNIIADILKLRLRFQVIKQEREQCFSVPVSTGILYFRDKKCSEANSFTLSVCDDDATISRCCNYGIYVEIEEFEPEGNVMIANPVLIATLLNTG